MLIAVMLSVVMLRVVMLSVVMFVELRTSVFHCILDLFPCGIRYFYTEPLLCFTSCFAKIS
jgi:hypothetical protein